MSDLNSAIGAAGAAGVSLAKKYVEETQLQIDIITLICI